MSRNNQCIAPNIVIYGSGRNGIRLYKWLKAIGMDKYVYAFCDKKYKDIKLPWSDVRIFSYDELKSNKYIYLVTPIENEEIVERLKTDGYEFYCDVEGFIYKYCGANQRAKDLISSEVFELNENNKKLQEYYRLPNYKIVDYNIKSNRCYIFFSGHGLWYPNTKGTFFKIIDAEDRYEWENIVEISDVPNIAARCIYIRDVHKTW